MKYDCGVLSMELNFLRNFHIPRTNIISFKIQTNVFDQFDFFIGQKPSSRSKYRISADKILVLSYLFSQEI
jgi:hypothetical protein